MSHPPLHWLREFGPVCWMKLWALLSWEVALELWNDTDTVPARIMSSLTALGWGVTLILFDPFEAGNFHENLAAIMPEAGWAPIFLGVSFAQGFLILSGHRCERERRRHLRNLHLGVTACAVVLWTTIAVSAVAADPVTASAGVYLLLVLGSTWELARTP